MEIVFNAGHSAEIFLITNGWEKHYTYGVTKSWTEHLQSNKIIELNRKVYYEGRGMYWGKY